MEDAADALGAYCTAGLTAAKENVVDVGPPARAAERGSPVWSGLPWRSDLDPVENPR